MANKQEIPDLDFDFKITEKSLSGNMDIEEMLNKKLKWFSDDF